MESLDTSILIRLITRDNPELCEKIKNYIEHSAKLFYVDDQVFTEMAFVLERCYDYSREQTSLAVEAVNNNPQFVKNKEFIRETLLLFRAHPKLSFVDCYLAVKAARKPALPLWTCDQKLALQSPSAKLFK